jgi:hypothetical protein
LRPLAASKALLQHKPPRFTYQMRFLRLVFAILTGYMFGGYWM